MTTTSDGHGPDLEYLVIARTEQLKAVVERYQSLITELQTLNDPRVDAILKNGHEFVKE